MKRVVTVATAALLVGVVQFGTLFDWSTQQALASGGNPVLAPYGDGDGDGGAGIKDCDSVGDFKSCASKTGKVCGAPQLPNARPKTATEYTNTIQTGTRPGEICSAFSLDDCLNTIYINYQTPPEGCNPK
jgi:hypothetical protein